MNNIVLIAAMDAQSAAENLKDASLEERARAAMDAVRHHWMATREEDQFLAACEGLARTATPEEMERIEDDLRRLAKVSGLLNAMSAGVPVDWDSMEADEPLENPLGLRKMWADGPAPTSKEESSSET